MNKLFLKIEIVAFLIIIIATNLQVTLVEASGEQASINAADASINQAFKNVLTIEKAGGDVTELLARLNDAGELLAEAENAYKSGNMTEVASKAQSARTIANQVNSETLNMRFLSLIGAQDSLWLILILSVVGAVVFSLILFFMWRRFKSSYLKRLLDMKPEVAENAT